MDIKGAKKQTKTEKTSLLGHFKAIIELAKHHAFGEATLEAARPHLRVVRRKLALSGVEAVFFAHFLNADNTAGISDIARMLGCEKIDILQYKDAIDSLEKKKLIRRSVLYVSRGERSIGYRVPMEVIDAIGVGKAFVPASHRNISTDELFDVLEKLMQQYAREELSFDLFIDEIHSIIENNQHLQFCHAIKSFEFSPYELLILLLFCNVHINKGVTELTLQHISDQYHDCEFIKREKNRLKDGSHKLIDLELIENSNVNGFGEKELFHLTNKAKDMLLSEVKTESKSKKHRNWIIHADSIPQKHLAFNTKEKLEIDRLRNALTQKNFLAIRERLGKNNMRSGFCCLLSGPPGTGKTETVYQIARETGRDLIMVDISQTKSMWFGESEKRIKSIFDKYRSCIESDEITPILLFNEADGVFGKRKDTGMSGPAQTENAIQNIILQELENLNGIMIATTNLTGNLDKAFERRFLFKIQFEKPESSVRAEIWQTMIPSLSSEEALHIAERFDFSGGQIENVARKQTIESVLSGTETSFDDLMGFCKDEPLESQVYGKIGFSSS
jgi:hypothetical protein